ncbi:ferredoxin [Nocardioides allogilvus]|uniref:ferredoxin n=1 Tax=Nocardioides allogilvus TaxID=2072017 RepID=UPI000D3244CD|nr:ferredoxin [Nocardioides allogilvus]
MTTHRPAPRPDVRLDDGAMEPVTCTTCSARVEVRKSSWEQTSIQWHGEALRACLERRATDPGCRPNATFAGCSALDIAIREAAVRGALPVQSGDPLPVNPEGESH